MAGYYRLSRGWMKHHVFGSETYTRAQAWCWMIEEAGWQDRRISVGGRTVTLRRGQFSLTSPVKRSPRISRGGSGGIDVGAYVGPKAARTRTTRWSREAPDPLEDVLSRRRPGRSNRSTMWNDSRATPSRCYATVRSKLSRRVYRRSIL